MRPFIVIGDRTDHGGVVIGSAMTTDSHGKRLARVGDQVTCPKKGHGGTTVIVTGDPTMIIDGQPAARHGDKCACGATLIAAQAVSRTSDGGASNPQAASEAQKAAAAGAGLFTRLLPTSDDVTHDMHFLVQDEETGAPLANVPYKLTLVGGTSITGTTDGNGMTEKVSSNTTQIAQIEVPYHGDSSSATYSNLGCDACGC